MKLTAARKVREAKGANERGMPLLAKATAEVRIERFFYMFSAQRWGRETTVNSEEEAFFTPKNLLFSSPASRSCHQIGGAFFFLSLSLSLSLEAMTKNEQQRQKLSSSASEEETSLLVRAHLFQRCYRAKVSPSSCDFFLPYLKTISDTLLFSLHSYYY